MAKILSIGTHPDDVDAGMGGSIIKFVSAGHEVHILDLTNGEPTPFGDPETRKKEWGKASKILNIHSRIVLDLPNRYLFDTVDARMKVAQVIRKIRPDVLFLPYWEDAHPDHIQATQICEAARFYAKLTKTDMLHEPWYPKHIFYYYWSNLKVHISPAFIIDISKEYENKILAVKAYQSQFMYSEEQWKSVENKAESICRYFGSLIGVQYGEPFASRENIGLVDIRDIVNIGN